MKTNCCDWTVGIAGGGSMGSGIAQIAATNKHQTFILETDSTAVAATKKRLQRAFDASVKHGALSTTEATEALARICISDDIAPFAKVDVVIEAVVEDIAIKKKLYQRIEAICPDSTIIATNTSSLPVRALAEAIKKRHRFAGMHFFNPAPRMKLVEIIAATTTADEVSDALSELARHWQKIPVVAQDAPGFIVNRLARPFYGEALRLLTEEHADPVYIDAALQSAGFRLGAFELMDLIGNDVNYAVTESVWQAMGQDERFSPSALQKQKCDDGLFGKKSGAGFYRYTDNGNRQPPPLTSPLPSPKPLPPITLCGEHAGLAILAQAVADGGAVVHKQSGDVGLHIGDVCLQPVEAKPTSVNNGQTILIDYVVDYAASALFVLSAIDTTEAQQDNIRAFFAVAGKHCLLMTKIPAMIALRTVAMMVNLAADAKSQGLATADDMNTAMRCGLNHPHGPFEWPDIIGGERLLTALRQLHQHYGGNRYQPCAALSGAIE